MSVTLLRKLTFFVLLLVSSLQSTNSQNTQFAEEGSYWHYCISEYTEPSYTEVMNYERDTTIQSLGCSILSYANKELVLCTDGQQVKYLMNDSLFVLYDFSLLAGDSYSLRLPNNLDFGYSFYESSDPNWIDISIESVEYWQANDSTNLKIQNLGLSNSLSCFMEWGPLVEQVGGLSFMLPNCSFGALDGCCVSNIQSVSNGTLEAINENCGGSIFNACSNAISVSGEVICNEETGTVTVNASVSGGNPGPDGSITYSVNSSLGPLLPTSDPQIFSAEFDVDDVPLDISASDGNGCSSSWSDEMLGDSFYIDCFPDECELVEGEDCLTDDGETGIVNDNCECIALPCLTDITISGTTSCNIAEDNMVITVQLSGGTPGPDGTVDYLVDSDLGPLFPTSFPGEYIGIFYECCSNNTVSVSDGLACSATWESSCSVGIESLEALGITLGPNPAESFLSINSFASLELTIYNLNGQLVLREKLSAGSTTLNVEHLVSGLYLAHISQDGRIGAAPFLKL